MRFYDSKFEYVRTHRFDVNSLR